MKTKLFFKLSQISGMTRHEMKSARSRARMSVVSALALLLSGCIASPGTNSTVTLLDVTVLTDRKTPIVSSLRPSQEGLPNSSQEFRSARGILSSASSPSQERSVEELELASESESFELEESF